MSEDEGAKYMSIHNLHPRDKNRKSDPEIPPMTSFRDERKKASVEEAYKVEARLEESLAVFSPIQGNKTKEKTVPI